MPLLLQVAVAKAEMLVFIMQNYIAAAHFLPNNDADWEICMQLLASAEADESDISIAGPSGV